MLPLTMKDVPVYVTVLPEKKTNFMNASVKHESYSTTTKFLVQTGNLSKLSHTEARLQTSK